MTSVLNLIINGLPSILYTSEGDLDASGQLF